MVGQDTEKGTWSESLESARDSDSSTCNEKPSLRTPSVPVKASSTAIRSVQHGVGAVSSASAHLYRHSWPKVSSASARLYERTWPQVRSRALRAHQRVWPKLSSASVRVYQRTWPKLSSTVFRPYRHDVPETSSAAVRAPWQDRLEITAMSLRLFQCISALYIFIAVTESLRSKLTYDGRVRQIQPMVSPRELPA